MTSPLEQFFQWEKETPDATAFQQPFAGVWKTWTWKEAGAEIRKVAAGIESLQLPRRSKIALLSKNCAHWIMADMAIMMTGNISVPLYPTLTAPSIRQILEHSDAAAIIIGKLDQYDAQKDGIPASVKRIGIELYNVRETYSWEKWVASNTPLDKPAIWDEREPVSIMYTSGTTGGPKGVMHSIFGFGSLSTLTETDLGLPWHPRLFSYLPLSHIAERAGVEFYGIRSGAVFSFAESLESFPRDLMHVQPHLLFAVPRIWSKFQEKILEKLPQKKLNLLLSLPLVSSLIKNSIRKKLGAGKATHIYSGAAPISIDLLKWFDRLGITIFQAIGMTEDGLHSHFNRHGANKYGTVGKKLSGVSSRISDEGELRLKGDGMMLGYFKEPEMTSKSFDEDGYFRTGDLAEYDNEGFLTITGRLKDQFKTDKGKYISPAPIETMLLANTDVEQTCVVGMGIPQPIALIVLSASGKLKSRDEIEKSLRSSFEEINHGLQKYEKLEKAVIMKNEWTIDNGLVTPTLKIKRNEVEKIHLPKYPAWYKTEGLVFWEN